MTMLNSSDFQKKEKYTMLMAFAELVLDGKHPGCYANYDELTDHVDAWLKGENPSPEEAWSLKEHE